MAQKPTSVSSLSASATAMADRLARHRVGRALAACSAARWRGDLGLDPGRRVIAAHQALQLGELADHALTQVGLGELAARSACSGSASTAPAIWSASSAMRSTRSFWVPSFSWKVIAGELRHLVERLSFRSCSQKNLASESRAAITFSLPATIAAAVLRPYEVGDASRKRLASFLASALAQREALLVLLHRGDQALGRHPRKASSKEPISTTGHSVSPAFSASSASSSTRSSFAPWRARAPARRSARARSSPSRMTLCARSFLRSRRSSSPRTARCHEAMAARDVAALDAVDLERHDLAVEQAKDRMQRPHPAKLAARPSAWISAREVARRSPARPRR